MVLISTASVNRDHGKHSAPVFTRIASTQRVIGSVADVELNYVKDTPITVIHLLDCAHDNAPEDPVYLEVRLCGDQTLALRPYVHDNIVFLYSERSPSISTDCFSLLAAERWHDNTRWKTTAFDPNCEREYTK
jgi:hypothetical protein